MMKFRVHGLVADCWKLIRIMQMSGHFLFEYHAENSFMLSMMRFGYSMTHLVLIMFQYIFLIVHLMMHTDDANDLSANTITVLFFAHCLVKFIYVALRNKKVYRTLGAWNTANSHPLFAENQARHHATAVTKIAKLVRTICIGTGLSVFGWTMITFVGENTEAIKDPNNANDTVDVEMPRLMMASWYPWDTNQSFYYLITFVWQLYFLTATMYHSNLSDTLFCTWLIFTCEQLIHLKEIMKPLMELSASLDTFMPQTSKLFRVDSASSTAPLISDNDNLDMNMRGIYSSQGDYSEFNRQSTAAISTLNGGLVGPNGLTKKQELLVRSAIKYWVERHKHVVRFVAMISDTYGAALLLHMLISTVTLTLLAYQATKIETFDVYACTVLGYLFYTFAQVFLFCYHGNRLIEESSSVLEAAYSCHWYDGSEEAKTFIQIVCQQCQKAMIISGAKFFTVSLDLFASVLGAVVTYFMVLVQLK